jgi:hypothetical protein
MPRSPTYLFEQALHPFEHDFAAIFAPELHSFDHVPCHVAGRFAFAPQRMADMASELGE